jgi:sporulenol synthase
MEILQVSHEIERRMEQFFKEQREDGSWRYLFEGPLMTDAYMIITLRALEMDKEWLIQRLARRILSKQEENGVWKVYPNEPEGNLTATVEAVLALLYSGYVDPNDIKMKKAYAFIRSHGGLKKTNLITRTFLAMNGCYPWPRLPFNPAYLVLLPKSSPINFYSFSSYARAHFAPALVAFEHRFSIKNAQTPDLGFLETRFNAEIDSDWPEIEMILSESRFNPFSLLKKELYKWKQIPKNLLDRADRWIEAYIFSHLEANGTLLGYASTTFLMIYGLMALGYKKDSPIILRAVQGLESLIWRDESIIHVQNSPSAVWDTGLMGLALLDAGCTTDHPALKKAADYLLKQQQVLPGDWVFHNPGVLAGGWGFSDSDSRHPDNDDTQTAIRTIQAFADESDQFTQAFERGFHWLLSMQNNDGGFASFEKNTDQYLIGLLPIPFISKAGIDPSIPDITGRVLNAIGTLGKTSAVNSRTDAAVRWLKNRQEKDGSWYGRWGVCYIYGTWAALTGLSSVGVGRSDPAVQKAIKWLNSIQNEDGGWGESCESDVQQHYRPLGESTIVQTAWATDALIAVHDRPTTAIQKGMTFLLDHDELEESYPTGAGLPGQFYIRYGGYPRYFPLLTLAHYQSKYHGS